MYEELLAKLNDADGDKYVQPVTELLKAKEIQPNQCATLLRIKGLQWDFNAVLELLELGVRIEKQDDKDIINAAILQKLEDYKWVERQKVWALIFAGADINALSADIVQDILGIPSPLHHYVEIGDVKAVERIIGLCKDNADLLKIVLTAKDHNGNVLHIAAHHNVSGKEVDPEASNKEAIVSIILEACKPYPELLETVLNAKNRDDYTPLTRSLEMYTPNMKVAKLLIDASPEIQDCDVGGLPLLSWVVSDLCQVFTENNKYEVVKALLDKNPSLIHSKDSDGKQPLHCACKESPEVIQLLIERGADPTMLEATTTQPPVVADQKRERGEKELTKSEEVDANLPPAPQVVSAIVKIPSESDTEDELSVDIDEEQMQDPKVSYGFSISNIVMASAFVSSVAILCYAAYTNRLSISNIQKFCSAMFDRAKDVTHMGVQK